MARSALSRAADVSERYLAQLESGEGNASVVLLRRIAVALGVFIVLAHRLSHASRVVIVVVLAGADLGVYLANGAYATVPRAVARAVAYRAAENKGGEELSARHIKRARC